ncbi:hypothetical protein BKA61DRAFT_183176 [Leptodontidium sp. MPI-SDFR-AT-0119]|nr:hypothetical protein BKA61DRAFT_183176 [Leptodontidium sp. MPI-SDFR-AT-0119]
MSPVLKTLRDAIIGASPPPPGVIPNFKNPESQGYRVTLTIAILFPLATIVLLLRLYTRIIIVRNVGIDDYVIGFAWALSIGFITTAMVLTPLGLGVHIWNVPLTTLSPGFLLIGTISCLFYGLSFMCVKLSILLLYLRLSPYKSFRIAVWVIVATTVSYSFLASFEFLFNCQPIAKNWDLSITKGKCIYTPTILMTHGSINIVTDIAMLLLPIALVRKVNAPMKEKVALACLFMTGTLVCIVSAIRLKALLTLISSPDVTWVASDYYIWSVLELDIGIICACLSSFKPFLRRHFPKVIGSSYSAPPITATFGANAANNLPRTLTDQYELGLCDRHKRSIPRESKQQTSPDNESQKDILGDGFPEGMLRGNEAKITPDCELFSQKDSQKGSVQSDCSGVPPASREEEF